MVSACFAMSQLSMSIVQSLDEASLVELYGREDGVAGGSGGNEWTVRAVFSMLGLVEQQIVLRLACCGRRGVSMSMARRWINCSEDEGYAFTSAISRLEGLRCVELVSDSAPGGERTLRLGAAFCANVRRALAGASREPWRSGPQKGASL